MITKIQFKGKERYAIVLSEETDTLILTGMTKALVNALGDADLTRSDNYFAHLLLAEMLPKKITI